MRIGIAMRPVLVALSLLLTTGLVVLPGRAAAQGDGSEVLATFTLPDIPLAELQNEALPGSPISDDRGMLLGGIGSDLWRAAGDPVGEFWMITDRGPNGQIEVDGDNHRTFPVPDFTPLILHVRAEGETLTVLEAIPIVGQSGAPVTGLSNLEGIDEAPYDFSAQDLLDYNPSGLDTEGLLRTPDGTFWLVEEYSPSILHVDTTGKVIARYVPEGLPLVGTDYPVKDVLPAIYAKRKINRGFEGIALSPDGTTLYATLQSPLSNPDKDTGEASRNTRILAFDIASEQPVAEYVYQFEVATDFDPNPEVTPDDMKLSGVVALDATTLLIDERTDDVAKLYIVDLTDATNILGGPFDDPETAQSLEATENLLTARVVPLAKTLLVDLSTLDGVPGKIEGVAVVDATTVAIANDNDFDIGDFDEAGRNVGEGKKSQLLLIQTPPIPGIAPGATPVPDGGTPAATPIAGAVTVEIRSFAFRPSRIEITPGTTVTWVNRDLSPHTATNFSLDRVFDSGRLDLNGSFSMTFTDPGAYAYECAYHQNMGGAVVVQ